MNRVLCLTGKEADGMLVLVVDVDVEGVIVSSRVREIAVDATALSGFVGIRLKEGRGGNFIKPFFAAAGVDVDAAGPLVAGIVFPC